MTQPIVVTHEQAVETLAQMVKDGHERIAGLERIIAKYVWATKTHWRTEFIHARNSEDGWGRIGEDWKTPEAAREAAERFRKFTDIQDVRIIRVETTIIETEVTDGN